MAVSTAVAVALMVAVAVPVTAAPQAPAPYSAIPNGQLFYDTAGHPIQAHGGGFLQVGDTHYWVGEDKTANSSAFGGTSLYKSTDLENWTRLPNVLTADAADAAGNRPLAHAKLERPKLLYNAKTKKYVLVDRTRRTATPFPRATMASSGPSWPTTPTTCASATRTTSSAVSTATCEWTCSRPTTSSTAGMRTGPPASTRSPSTGTSNRKADAMTHSRRNFLIAGAGSAGVPAIKATRITWHEGDSSKTPPESDILEHKGDNRSWFNTYKNADYMGRTRA